MDEDLYNFYKHCIGNVARIIEAKWSDTEKGFIIGFDAPNYSGQLARHNIILIPVDEYDKDFYKLHTPDYENYDE